MRLFPVLTPLIGLSLLLGACGKDEKTPGTLTEKTYFGMTELAVTYDGSGMSGKRAVLKPGANATASITFDGAFDLSTLSDKLKGMPAISTAGVLPGSPQLALDVSLKAGDGNWTFAGKGETDYATYSYTGTVTPDLMTFNLADVRLKNQTLAGGVWAPEKGDGNVLSSDQVFHIVWELGKPIQIPGLDIGLQELLRALVNYPFIPVYHDTASMSLAQVLLNGLRTLAFTSDGNLVATYLQTANGASTFTQAPLTMMQYVALSDSKLLLFVNPTDILSLVLLNNTNRDPNIPENPWTAPARTQGDTSSVPTLDVATIIASLNQAAKLVAAGIPMDCPHTATNMELYIGTETLLPLMQNVLLPVLNDPQVQQMILEYVKNNPTLAANADKIQLALSMIELVIEQTTKIEFGINLTASK